MNNKITVICGHYGSGKTNLCLNLALMSSKRSSNTIVVDMDIVNPYFRSGEYGELLREKGIELICPTFLGSTLDTPAIPASVSKIFVQENADIFIDAGGDDAGVTALATLSEAIKGNGYEMVYVINKYRVLSQEPTQCIRLLEEIEKASRLRATGIVNNSHLGVETVYQTVMDSISFAKEVSRITECELLYTTIPDFAAEKPLSQGLKEIQRLVKFPWE